MVFQVLAYLLPAGAVALGLMFAASAVRFRRRAAVCAAWPTVAGEIIGARIDTQIEDDLTETERDHASRALTEVVLSAATVRYGYHVAGHDYQSTRIYPGRPIFSSNPAAAAALIAKYPPRAQVSVHYNPANPAEAVLEPSNLVNANLALMAALGFGAPGLLTFLAVWNMQ